MAILKKTRNKIVFSLMLCLAVGGGVLWYAGTAQGVNRTWDGGGVDGTCGGAGTANNWTCAANWSGDTVPTSADIAIFDGTSTKNATINANLSGGTAPAGISINAGYTGTITQSGSFTVDVGASGYSQAVGTFTGGSGAITVNGTFTLSGGTFTSTSGTLKVGRNASSETMFTVSGGSFNHNSGTVQFVGYWDSGCSSPATHTIDVPSSLTLYNVVVNAITNACGYPNKVTTATGDTIIAANNFTHTDGVLLGTWEVQGNVVIANLADGGDGTITYTGTGSKTFTYTAGGLGPHLRVNNAGISVSASGGTTDLAVSLFSLLSGTFNAPSGLMSIGRWGNGAETFFTISGGTFNHNNGTVSFVQSSGAVCSGTHLLTVDVVTSLTLNNIVINTPANQCGYVSTVTTAAGDTIIANGSFTQTDGWVGGTWEVQGNYTVGAGADGGTAGIAFTGGNNQIYTDSGGNEPDGDITINKSGGTVTLASAADWNAASQDLTITAGTLFAPDASIATTTLTVGASGVLKMFGNQTLTLGGTLSNSGTVQIWGSGVCDGGDNALIRSSSNGVQRSWNGAGTFTLYDIDVRDMAGSASLTAYSSTNTANNGANWTFSGAACPAVPPAIGLSSGKFNLQSGKFNLR